MHPGGTLRDLDNQLKKSTIHLGKIQTMHRFPDPSRVPKNAHYPKINELVEWYLR